MIAHGFDAKLPELTDGQFDKLCRWAKESCQKSDVFMKDGTMHIIAIRKEAKTARSFQSLLRTLMTNWGVELPRVMVGWLSLLSDEDFEKRRREPYQKPEIAVEKEPYRKPPEIAIENTSRLRLPVNLLMVPRAIICT